jgi:integrase
MTSIKISKNTKKGVVNAPPEFVRDKIIETATTVDFGLWALMLLCTGLRRGEQAAIMKKDINFEKNEISLTHAVEFVHNQPNVKERLKTDDSKTTIPILNKLKPYLVEACNSISDDDFLFGGVKPLTETQIKKKWKKYCNEIGYTFKGHQLRHAYALLLYEAGVDIKTAQRLLRHSDIRTTMNIYTEFSKKMTDKSVEMLDKYLGAIQ